MKFSKYSRVYWSETRQRPKYVRNTSAGDIPVSYEYVGMMTLAEYELLIEVLFELFEDDPIKLEAFQYIFGDIRAFCDKLKNILEQED